MGQFMSKHRWVPIALGIIFLISWGIVFAVDFGRAATSYAPVSGTENLESVILRMKAAKPGIMKRQLDLLAERYDLGNRPLRGVTMSGGKAVQQGVRVKLPQGMTWDKLAAMTPEEIKLKDVWPAGFYPLPHPNHPEGGMVFPQFH